MWVLEIVKEREAADQCARLGIARCPESHGFGYPRAGAWGSVFAKSKGMGRDSRRPGNEKGLSFHRCEETGGTAIPAGITMGGQLFGECHDGPADYEAGESAG